MAATNFRRDKSTKGRKWACVDRVLHGRLCVQQALPTNVERCSKLVNSNFCVVRPATLARLSITEARGAVCVIKRLIRPCEVIRKKKTSDNECSQLELFQFILLTCLLSTFLL